VELAILVPVLGRPHRVRPLLNSIAEATAADHRVLFLTDPKDALEHELWAVGGNYASKINAGVRVTDEPFVFLAADDLNFHPGWFENAKALLDGPVGVVGVNDLIDRNRDHATHFLMARWYAQLPTIDQEPGPVQEAYTHWFCDDELIATARNRGAYAYAEDSHVEHLHPMVGKADDDDTYRQGRQGWRLDRRLFNERQALWT
jgi:glycosyltransferase involved in cell wall biosynthesis